MDENVAKAVALLDVFGYGENAAWQAIRAHLLSQDAEIERMKRALGWHEREGMTTGAVPVDYHHSVKVARDAAELAESRLAAANALLCKVREYINPDWRLWDEINEHLSENAK